MLNYMNGIFFGHGLSLAGPSVVELMVFFSSGSQCWYFSHEPSSLFQHSVLVDLSVSMMMHLQS